MDIDIDADTPFNHGSLIRLRGNSTSKELMYAARMDAISYLRLTGQPITSSAVDSLLNEYRDNVQPVPVDYEGNRMDEEEKRKRVAAKLKGDYLQNLSDDDVLEGFEGTYSKAFAELDVAREELFKQIQRQAKDDKLLLISMYALIISAVVIVLFT